jgi:molybdopterin synthase catalytic subunit
MYFKVCLDFLPKFTENNHHIKGKKVTKLFYEAHVPLALKTLQLILKTTRDQFDPNSDNSQIFKLRIEHLLGDCPIGQPGILVGAATESRKLAFQVRLLNFIDISQCSQLNRVVFDIFNRFVNTY